MPSFFDTKIESGAVVVEDRVFFSIFASKWREMIEISSKSTTWWGIVAIFGSPFRKGKLKKYGCGIDFFIRVCYNKTVQSVD